MALAKPRALLSQLAEADLRLLRVFIAIAESGGLAAAELRLNISRSVISRHLKDLEIRLGVRLCERGRAGFALSEEGVVVLAAARTLLAQIEAFRGEIAELHAGMRGELNLAVFDKFATNPACRLAEALARLADEAPGVAVNLHVAGSAEIERGLLEGRFHLAIQPFHRASESFISYPLFIEPMALYCGAGHELAAQAEAPQEAAIRAARFVGLGYHSVNMELFWRLGLTPTARAFDQEASAALILSGRYIGFLPDHYAASLLAAGAVRRIEAPAFRYVCDWHAFLARSPAPARPARHLLQWLRELHGAGGAAEA